MNEIILIKYGELVLKGLNRSSFEGAMERNIKHVLKNVGDYEFFKSQSTITITPADEFFDMDEACKKIGKVFGIAAFSRACVCKKDITDIIANAKEYLNDTLSQAKTFKVEAKRSDKRFPLKSPEISAQLGGALLAEFKNLKVDVHNPDITVTVEIRERSAFVRANQLKGAGGLPVSTGGRAGILISGGIDSPVAAWLMAKRGVQLNAFHFASPPYTSERAELKVKKLLSKVAEYSGPIKLGIVPFTEIQDEIAKCCPEEYFTVIMRRMMMRISQKLAEQTGCLALITGESLGQVASQTLPALTTTACVCSMPVLRPLIGMDKIDIIDISKRIGAFEISIEPYEDCCTVFTPKHPKTRPTPALCLSAEQNLDIDTLVEKAVKDTVYTIID